MSLTRGGAPFSRLFLEMRTLATQSGLKPRHAHIKLQSPALDQTTSPLAPQCQKKSWLDAWDHQDIERTAWRSSQVHPKPRDRPSRTEKSSTWRFKLHGFPSLCVLTRTVLHERASVHDKRTTRHDNPVTQMTDKRGEEPASGRPRSPPLGGGCGGPKAALQHSHPSCCFREVAR